MYNKEPIYAKGLNCLPIYAHFTDEETEIQGDIEQRQSWHLQEEERDLGQEGFI